MFDVIGAHIRLAAMTAAAALVAATPLHAQQYPAKPVRIVVGFPAGGAVDILARAVAPRLAESLGQQVLVDNRPGASSTIAAEIAAKSAPGGYTLLMVSAAHAVNPSLYKKLPYDTERDFVPISLVAATPYILVVHPSLPVRNVRDLIQLAKQHRGELSYASSGNGGLPHLSGELLKLKAGIEMSHIPYKGSAAVTRDVLGGHVPICFNNLLSAMPHVHGGRLRALGVTSAKRLEAAPDVPAIAEAGLPGYEVVGWYGMLAPAGTSKEIVARLSKETERGVRAPDVGKRLASEGVDAVGSTPDAFASVIRTDIVKWGEVVRASGAKVD
jgi:tripartite-type tricarboxylate transporter receptor subunit TctC